MKNEKTWLFLQKKALAPWNWEIFRYLCGVLVKTTVIVFSALTYAFSADEGFLLALQPTLN